MHGHGKHHHHRHRHHRPLIGDRFPRRPYYGGCLGCLLPVIGALVILIAVLTVLS